MRGLLKLGSFFAALPLVLADTDSGDAATPIIYKDVAIIGGGASGAYSAVRLREDEGLSVVVVEKQDRLVRLI